jgi:flagellar biosynthesis/type III secretory pathway protein FliH
VKSVKVPFKITITRAHYAGHLKTKPSDAELAAIEKAEALNKAHEEAHRDGYQKVFDDAKLEEELVGKTPEEAKALIAKVRAALTAECEKLHKSGGVVFVTPGPKGTVKVDEKPEGPGGCR